MIANSKLLTAEEKNLLMNDTLESFIASPDAEPVLWENNDLLNTQSALDDMRVSDAKSHAHWLTRVSELEEEHMGTMDSDSEDPRSQYPTRMRDDIKQTPSRSTLLAKCWTAIESLNDEIEEERDMWLQLEEERSRLIQDIQLLSKQMEEKESIIKSKSDTMDA